MSSRFDNKRLYYLLSGLVALLVITIVVKVPGERSTLKSKVVEFDTAAVDNIILYPRVSNGKAVEFIRTNGLWRVRQDEIVAMPQEGSVRNIFNEVLNLKPQSLAALNKSKWKEFDLTDSLATRIKFLNKKGKVIADLMIGRISYKPQQSPYASYGGNNMQVSSFVREYSEQKVYSVDGFISFSLNVKFDDWRDRTFIKSNKDDLTNISFIYPGDSSFVLSKKDKTWNTGSQIADSASVSNYLSSLGVMNGETFRDKYSPVSSPAYQMIVEGNNLLKISVKCFQDENKTDFILNSSLNPEVYFSMKKEDLFGKLLKPKKSFLKSTGRR
jgi:hypothetical protein